MNYTPLTGYLLALTRRHIEDQLNRKINEIRIVEKELTKRKIQFNSYIKRHEREELDTSSASDNYLEVNN